METNLIEIMSNQGFNTSWDSFIYTTTNSPSCIFLEIFVAVIVIVMFSGMIFNEDVKNNTNI